MEEGLTMEWFYGIVNFLWSEENMYVTIVVITSIIGYLHTTNRGE